MQIDAGFESSLTSLQTTAQHIEATKAFTSVWVSDTANDPFLLAGLALEATTLHVGTNIVVAFARSPFVVAQTAWNLAGLFQGRFLLGLGPQIRPHIEKRFSMPWPEHPVEAMQDYLSLLRHLFHAFATGERPHFRSKSYTCTLGSPVFTPDHHNFGPPPLGIAAVGPYMTELAARAADLILLHPFTHLAYLQRVTLPAIEQGLLKRPKDLPALTRVGSCFIVPTDHPNADTIDREVRKRVAFYASTPNYVKVLDTLGLNTLHNELHQLSRQGQWQKMGQILPQELLDHVVVRAPIATLQHAVKERYSGIYDRVILDPTPWLTVSPRS